VLLAVEEGGFEASLADAVWAGERRPRGHLLLQSLSCHAGYRDAPTLRLLRVMRIAVHTNCRRQGVASVMLERLKEEANQLSIDMLGVSYALDVDVYTLWQSVKFKAVRLGYKRDVASGQHSLQMLLAVSDAGKQLTDMASARFQQQLPWLLAQGLNDLEADLVALLMTKRPCDDLLLSEQDRLDLQALAMGRRQWQEVVPLWHWLCRVLAGCELVNLQTQERDLLIALVLQHQKQPSIVATLGLEGAKHLTKLIRQAVARSNLNT